MWAVLEKRYNWNNGIKWKLTGRRDTWNSLLESSSLPTTAEYPTHVSLNAFIVMAKIHDEVFIDYPFPSRNIKFHGTSGTAKIETRCRSAFSQRSFQALNSIIVWGGNGSFGMFKMLIWQQKLEFLITRPGTSMFTCLLSPCPVNTSNSKSQKTQLCKQFFAACWTFANNARSSNAPKSFSSIFQHHKQIPFHDFNLIRSCVTNC